MKKAILLLLILIISGCSTQSQSNDSKESLAILEFSMLHDQCVELVWNNEPEPENPNEAIIQINKCIHSYANLDATKTLIENKQFEYSVKRPPVQFECVGKNCHPFKDPAYPNHDESKYF